MYVNQEKESPPKSDLRTGGQSGAKPKHFKALAANRHTGTCANS